jgi:hypothetical protein
MEFADGPLYTSRLFRLTEGGNRFNLTNFGYLIAGTDFFGFGSGYFGSIFSSLLILPRLLLCNSNSILAWCCPAYHRRPAFVLAASQQPHEVPSSTQEITEEDTPNRCGCGLICVGPRARKSQRASCLRFCAAACRKLGAPPQKLRAQAGPRVVPKNALCKKRFIVISNLWYIYRVLNVDEIKN